MSDRPPGTRNVTRAPGQWGATALAAGAAGGLAAGAVETAVLFLRGGVRALHATPAALALDLLAGLVIALGGAALLALVVADRRIREALAAHWAARKGPPEERARFAAATLAVLAAIAITACTGAALTLVLERWLVDARPVGLALVPLLVGVCVTLVPIAFLLERALERALHPLARRSPRAASMLPVLVAMSGIGAALALGLGNAAIRSSIPWPALSGLAVTVVLVALAAASLGSLAVRRRAVLAGVPAVAAVAAVVVAASSLDPVARSALGAHGMHAPLLAAALAAAADRDGDGFTRLGDYDCDDRDATVYPGALDPPGDGRDQDCSGADAGRFGIDFGPARAPGLPETARTAKNVLLLSIDALRADHVGAYGYAVRPTTPRIDALASTATLFERAYSAAPNTRRAVPGLLTGAHPLSLRFIGKGKTVAMDGADGTTIAEALHAAGFHTVYVNLHVGRSRGGVAEGFDETFHRPTGVTGAAGADAAAIGTRVSDWLGTRAAAPDAPPFFLWAHFMEPHEPYVLHPETASFGEDALARYDSEIAYADAAVGKILERLETTRLAASTLVIVTSDHGEHFGEHGERFHGFEVWEESIRVPLIVRAPGAPAHRIKTPVSTLDVAWTVYDFVGAPADGRARHGGSLAAAVTAGTEPTPRLVVATAFDRTPHGLRRIAALRWPFVLRVETDTGARACFDLSADPQQAHDVMALRPECSALVDELAAWRLAVPRPAAAGAEPAPAAGTDDEASAEP